MKATKQQLIDYETFRAGNKTHTYILVLIDEYLGYLHEPEPVTNYCHCESSIIDRTCVVFFCKACGKQIKMAF